MAQTVTTVVRALGEILKSAAGVEFALAQIAERESLHSAALKAPPIVELNVSPEILEKKSGAQYPSLYVYCDRLENQLTEKFRTFSGIAQMVVEVRVSQDQLAGIDEQARLYVDGVTQVLDYNRGDWGNGMFFGGVYRVEFQPIKHGGRHYLQTVRVTFELKVSSD